MPTNLIDLTADIVIAHASVTEMSSDDLLKEIKTVYATLEALEKGDKDTVTIETSTQGPKKRVRKPKGLPEAITKTEVISQVSVVKAPEPIEKKPEPQMPAMTIEEAFKPDQIACMICGKTGMVTLKRHLSSAHNLKPGQYRKQFNIPKDQSLAATQYVEKRRQIALDKGLGDKLAAAREAKKKKQTGE